MALPANAVTTNIDSAADDPKTARADLKANWDKFNSLLTHLNGSDITKDPLTPGDGLEKSTTTLRVQLQSSPGIKRGGTGIAVDINGTTAKTAPTASDEVLIHDAAAGVVKKATIPNLIKGAPLTNLSNVSAGSPSTNDALIWNGSAWVNGTATPADASVSTAKLKTATGDVSVVGTSRTKVVQAGGEYGFFPTLKNSTTTGTQGAFWEAKQIGSTSLANIMAMFTGAGQTITARQRYVQASPPYDLGDGVVPLFVLVVVSSGGSILGSYAAPDPPWANNGPTNIRPDFIDTRGRGFKVRPKGFPNPVPVAALVASPALREQFMDARRAVDRTDTKTFIKVEIDAAFKNADMLLLPHHLVEIPADAPEYAGATVVLLDPVSPVTEEFLAMHELEDPDSGIADLLGEGFIEFGNSAIPGRKAPPGVMPVSVNWKP